MVLLMIRKKSTVYFHTYARPDGWAGNRESCAIDADEHKNNIWIRHEYTKQDDVGGGRR